MERCIYGSFMDNMEKRKEAASNIIVELNKLKTKLKERLDNNLIPTGAKNFSLKRRRPGRIH